MTKSDDNLGVHEELQEADPIPDVFPGQDPKVDQEWEKAKEDPMAASPLELKLFGKLAS
jgi:hypothetical protein